MGAESAAGDLRLMRRALDLAALGPAADPNPRVGCLVTDAAGEVLATGFHRGAGTPHAEVAALAAAGEAARGGGVHVSLEPCDHTGRTGPCTQALRAAGITRVVYAQSDPGRSSAGGAARLRDLGLEVHGGVLGTEATALNREWTHAVTRGRPFVTWKSASSLDGRVAAADGTSRWITSAPARAEVHELRSRCGAVVVGTGTALSDDPHLTDRDAEGRPRGRQPLRVVVGRREPPRSARILDDAAPTLRLPTHDPAAVLAALHTREVRHVLLEGGPTLAAAFLTAGLVDEIRAYLAPALLGAGPAGVADLGVRTIGEAHRFDVHDIARVGPDVRLTLRPRPIPEVP